MPYKDSQKQKEYTKNWKKDHPDYFKQWYLSHIDKQKLYGQQWIRNNIEKARAKWNRRNKVRSSTPKGILNRNMGSTLCKVLAGTKTGRRWETLVGYTIEDLMQHIESLFDKNMNWDNYGKYEEGKYKWNLDHIKPQSLFKYETAEDPEFKQCWELENLQPLEAKANLQKSNHFELIG